MGVPVQTPAQTYGIFLSSGIFAALCRKNNCNVFPSKGTVVTIVILVVHAGRVGPRGWHVFLSGTAMYLLETYSERRWPVCFFPKLQQCTPRTTLGRQPLSELHMRVYDISWKHSTHCSGVIAVSTGITRWGGHIIAKALHDRPKCEKT